MSTSRQTASQVERAPSSPHSRPAELREHRNGRDETTVLVAVHSPSVREGLVAMIGALEGFRVLAEAASSEEALRMARAVRPALALVDQDLPGCGGAWTIQALRDERLVQSVVAMGMRVDPATLLRARTAGAQAYVQTGSSPDDLLYALRSAQG